MDPQYNQKPSLTKIREWKEFRRSKNSPYILLTQYGDAATRYRWKAARDTNFVFESQWKEDEYFVEAAYIIKELGWMHSHLYYAFVMENLPEEIHEIIYSDIEKFSGDRYLTIGELLEIKLFVARRLFNIVINLKRQKELEKFDWLYCNSLIEDEGRSIQQSLTQAKPKPTDNVRRYIRKDPTGNLFLDIR